MALDFTKLRQQFNEIHSTIGREEMEEWLQKYDHYFDQPCEEVEYYDTFFEYSFDISEPPINNYMQEAEDYQVLIDDNGRIHINLPMSNVDVVCRLMTGADELAVVKEAERKSKKKMQSATATDSFRSYIVSVNGDTSPFTIESFIQAMPARDARHLRTIYSKVVPNIDLTQNFDCSNCGHEADMEVPLGVDFFWPK